MVNNHAMHDHNYSLKSTGKNLSLYKKWKSKVSLRYLCDMFKLIKVAYWLKN